MSAEEETLRRVQDGLFHLLKGLTPFVEARMKAVHGTNWLHYASRARGSAPNSALDAYGLLKTTIDCWHNVFGEAFGRNEKHRVRTFTFMALEARHATSHHSTPLQDDEALRYLDAIHQLLKAARSPAAEVAELKRLYDEQRRSGVAGPVASEPPTTAKPTLLLPPPLSQHKQILESFHPEFGEHPEYATMFVDYWSFHEAKENWLQGNGTLLSASESDSKRWL